MYKLDEILKLRCLELVQALTTSCAERGISTLGQIKTKLRNRMKVSMANALMEIKLNGPGLDASNATLKELFAEALKLFFSEVKRNPNKAHFKPRPRRASATSAKSRPLVEVLESDDESDDGDRLVDTVAHGDLLFFLLFLLMDPSTQPVARGEQQPPPELDRSEEEELDAVYASIGDFDGRPGWAIVTQMPERKPSVLAKSNIKIAHKFTTGVPSARARMPQARNQSLNH